LIFLGTFFYVLVLITDVTASVALPLLETAYTLGASQRQTLWKVVLPAAAPDIMNSLKAMIGAAWTYLIVAELLAAQNGMGKDTQIFIDRGHLDKGLACMAVIGVIGVITNLLFQIASNLMFPWRRVNKAAEK
jgi:NitT/TauT family transport system permease protein